MFGFLPFILSAVLLGLGLRFLAKAFAKHEPANLPHGSMGFPLLGETLGFLKPRRSNSMGSFLQQHCSRYGRVFKSHLFGSPTLVSCDLELNTLILQTEEKLFHVSNPKAMHGILGKFSMIIVSGDIHKKLRNIGYETTATLTSLIVYFLALHPNVLQHLKQEHNAIRINKKNSEPLNWEDYQKMEFTYNVIYESMRCGNVVKFVHRVALQDVKFKGYFIPAGWKILPMLTAAHFNPSLHEDPMEFNPWRWTTLVLTACSFSKDIDLSWRLPKTW
ncbi:CYP724B1 protein [Hibiscus syriacus]|uniref:CYP724B1 protein n=1 Tax=Hibiscus syriacus TaxID=106335 RepID=A0A6A2X0J3_HIBSY|nr:CYP724B1 protein [Hibiscus syriacus]